MNLETNMVVSGQESEVQIQSKESHGSSDAETELGQNREGVVPVIEVEKPGDTVEGEEEENTIVVEKAGVSDQTPDTISEKNVWQEVSPNKIARQLESWTHENLVSTMSRYTFLEENEVNEEDEGEDEQKEEIEDDKIEVNQQVE